MKGEHNIDSRKKARLATKLAQDKKAEDSLILDMRKITNFCEYFVICGGNSQKQVDAIAGGIEEGLLEQKIKPLSNGKKNGLWNLLDYGDVIIHIFNKETRQYYDLERLWLHAPRISLPKS